MTDTVIHDFWLHVPAPDKGRQLDATCLNNHLTITSTNLTSATIFLDSRLIDFQKLVTLEANGQISKLKFKPDLRTLCETMQRRGDPSLAFSARINLALLTMSPTNEPPLSALFCCGFPILLHAQGVQVSLSGK